MTEATSGLRVLKFGGAGLRDASAIARVAALVAASPGPKALVVSAMEGVTDRLAAAGERALEDDAHVALALAELGTRHREALAGVAPQDTAAASALEGTLLRLERLLYGIASARERSARLDDLLHSFGERLSAPIVAAALRAAGVAAAALEGEQAGIRTRGPHGMANPDAELLRAACRHALVPLLRQGIVPVVTGYYGVDAQGHATIFGRGGSDYVAALMAQALDATVLELWKEVPGFLSADPRIVPDAHLLQELGYEEAAELAQFGARILHPRCVEPVQEAGIPIHIRPLGDPTARGTTIRSGPARGGLRGVACMDGIALLRLKGPGLAAQPGIARQVFEAIPGTNVLTVANSQTTLTIAVAEADAGPARARLAAMDGAIRMVEATTGHSLVCVVGSGLSQAQGVAARIFAAVAVAGVNVEMVSLAGNDIAFDFVVPTRQAADAVRAIHGHLEGAGP